MDGVKQCFVWIGKAASDMERKQAMSYAHVSSFFYGKDFTKLYSGVLMSDKSHSSGLTNANFHWRQSIRSNMGNQDSKRDLHSL